MLTVYAGPGYESAPAEVMYRLDKYLSLLQQSFGVSYRFEAHTNDYMGESGWFPLEELREQATGNVWYVNKSTTDIGDNAFIGSNSALVAPVAIGANTTVGAGSVISKTVENNELAIARAKQRNISGWQRPVKK